MPESFPPKNPDLSAIVRALCRQNRELTELVERLLGESSPPPTPSFVPTDFQEDIPKALKNKALRTDALGAKVGNRRKLFADPGGLPELQEEGRVLWHKRLGYYRPDAPPPELADADSDSG